MKAKINFRRYQRALIKKKAVIIIVFILSAAVGFLFNFKAKNNLYKATSKVYIASEIAYVEGSETSHVLQNYSDVVTSKKVADRAAMLLGDENYDGEIISGMVKCTYTPSSPVYKIHVTSINPDKAVEVANSVASAFVMEVNLLNQNSKAQVLDDAYECKMIFNGLKRQIINIALFAIIGMILCIVVICIIAYNSKRVETVDDVTLDGEIEILGVIPNFDVE